MVSSIRSIIIATLVVCACSNLPFTFAEINEPVSAVEQSIPEKLAGTNPAAIKNLETTNENTSVTKDDTVELNLRSKDIGNDSRMNPMNTDRIVDETAAAPTASAPMDAIPTANVATPPKTRNQLKKERKAALKNKQTGLNGDSLNEFGASDSSSDLNASSAQLDELTSGPNAAQSKSKKQRKSSKNQGQSKAKKGKGKQQKPKGKGKQQKPKGGKGGNKNGPQKAK